MKVNGLDKFVRHCEEARAAVPAGTRLGILGAANKTKGAILGAARSRGWNPKGWVGYNVFGAGESTFAVVSLKGAPAYWAERGTQAHDIEGKDKPLRTPYGPRWSVSVKGAKPRPFWDAGKAAALPLVSKEVARGVGTALGRVFGGG